MTERGLDFAREVVRELRPMLYREPKGSDFDIGLRDGYTRVRIDDILLDTGDAEPGVVILFRDIAEPEHLYRMQMEDMESGPEPVFGDPVSWATVIWANFCEKVESAPGLPPGSPGCITDI